MFFRLAGTGATGVADIDFSDAAVDGQIQTLDQTEREYVCIFPVERFPPQHCLLVGLTSACLALACGGCGEVESLLSQPVQQR